MRKSKYTESQIVQTLKQVEGGRAIKDVCRELGISNGTYYIWKSKYGGMEAADIRRLKELEEENSKLKRMYADLALEVTALKDVIAKKLQVRRRNARWWPRSAKSTASASAGPARRLDCHGRWRATSANLTGMTR